MMGSGFDIDISEFTLAGAKRGDLHACEKIYRRFHKQAFTVAIRICKCRELAQDVTQEAFITAFKRIGQYRGDSPFWGWLRRVIVNHAISALRKLPRHDAVEFEDYMATGIEPFKQ
jgi:RNA polymerase sigma-70 factor (ECF subfamily)